jgi:hypothetical protein
LGYRSNTTSSLYGGQSSVNALGFGGAGYNNLYQTYISHALDKVNHRLFVSDMGSARILVYQLDATNNIISTTPQYVLGTCDFTTPGSWSPSQNTFGFANTTYDPVNSRLFVSDGFNNRVLAFDVSTSAIHNCENATFVLGQPDFTSHGQNIGQNGLHGPDDTDYDSVNNRLFVSDSGNNRVMVFSVPGNATSSINGENAIFELGKPDFDSNSANDATQNRLGGTNGEAYDPVNSRIFVSDLTHNRVMAFSVPGNATSSINGENAIFELCQPDFFTSSPGRTNQNTCNIPDDLDYDSVNNRLFLGDKNNNRELVFVTPSGATSTINGENAQGLIGQSSWTANTSGLSQSQGNWLDSGHGYDGVNNRFYVDDVYNARVLEFNMIHITTPSFPAGIVGNAYSQSITVTSNQGVEQDYSVYSGNLPDGLSLNSSTGVISGTPTTAGSSTVTIEADDNYQSGSTFFDRKTYDFNINSTDTTPPVTTATPSGGTYGASRDITLACVDDLSGCNHIYYTTDGDHSHNRFIGIFHNSHYHCDQHYFEILLHRYSR